MSDPKPVNAIIVTGNVLLGNVRVLETNCSDYESFKSLPAAVEFDGHIYGRSGWNSDHETAYYRTDTWVAKAYLTPKSIQLGQ